MMIDDMRGGRTQAATNMAAGALTAGLIALVLAVPPGKPPPMMEAPEPTQVALSIVEEQPPPPPAAPKPPQEPPPPPPVQTAPSPLPPPPPRHVMRPKHLPPRPRIVEQPDETPAPSVPHPPAAQPARMAQQAPENHSAEAAYIGLLHGIVARNTVAPAGAAYRLAHPSGEVQIGFTLSRTGAVLNVHVIRSSGSEILDRQAGAIVAGQRYPAMPRDVYPGAVSHGFSVPVAFSYTGGAADAL